MHESFFCHSPHGLRFTHGTHGMTLAHMAESWKHGHSSVTDELFTCSGTIPFRPGRSLCNCIELGAKNRLTHSLWQMMKGVFGHAWLCPLVPLSVESLHFLGDSGTRRCRQYTKVSQSGFLLQIVSHCYERELVWRKSLEGACEL